MRDLRHARASPSGSMVALSVGMALCLVPIQAAWASLRASARPAGGACTGSWTLAATPNPSTKFNFLNGVSAASPIDVWAVGSQENQFFETKPLIEHFDGTDWSDVDVPQVNGGAVLFGVHALSTDAWAVGHVFTQGVQRTLIEHWDPITGWVVQDSPNPSSTSNQLVAVSASGPNDAWAVGVQFNPDQETLALHWDGVSWSVSSVPNPTNSTSLTGVVDLAPDDAWAVGSANSGPVTSQYFVHWDGSEWTPVKDHASRTGSLFAADASGPDDIWAVGTTGKGGHAGPWAEHFDGLDWVPVQVPRKPLAGSLNGVAVGSPSLAWAVGYAEDPDFSHNKSISEIWDGTRWTQLDVINPGDSPNELLAATADSLDSAWAVGAYQDTNGRWLTLAEYYC